MTISFFLVALLFVACGKKGDKGGSAKAGRGDPAVWAPFPLPKLGVVAQAPGDAHLSGMGDLVGMGSECTVLLFPKTSSSEGHDNYVHNIQAGNNGGELDQMVKDVKTDEDNWVIEYTTKTGKFGYQARHKVGDKVITCGHVSDTKPGHDCVIKVCESLTPAP